MKEYFKEVKRINDNGGGWSQGYYGILADLINEQDLKVGCEVGIGYGLHAENLLKTTNLEKLYLVDLMEFYENDLFPIDIVNNGGFELLKKEIFLNLEKYKDKYEFFKCSSISITNEQISDESLDFVFIDANHSYEFVRDDLEFWYKKVKKGGYITGDDYDNTNFGVKKAVDEFSLKTNLELKMLNKIGKSSSVYCLKKI